jgi:hypothetical protein
LKKTDGSWFFGPLFWLFYPKWALYGFIEKRPPQKALCLGPDPPPWRKHDFYRNLLIFNVFGAFNRAGKSVSKIGIYALPPPESEIYGDFINYRVNCCRYTVFLKYFIINWFKNLSPRLWNCVLMFPFLRLGIVLAL